MRITRTSCVDRTKHNIIINILITDDEFRHTLIQALIY